MLVYDMQTNHLKNPLGYSLLDGPSFSYKVKDTAGKRQVVARVCVASDEGMQNLLFDSGMRTDIDSLAFRPDIDLAPCTRYWWQVTVGADNVESVTSAPSFFETGKMDESWQASWITAPVQGNMNLYRTFTLEEAPQKARVYITAVGLYELYINGEKAGDELLAPFYTAYDKWLQVETYDVAPLLKAGENEIRAMLGDGWYKGRLSFDGGHINHYGDTQALLMELRMQDAQGNETVIGSDTQWEAAQSKVRFSNIYDGEIYDATFDDSARMETTRYDGLKDAPLMDRLSPPVRVTQRLTPASIFTTPAGETVLDLGQEITGYLAFRTSAPRGTALKLSYFEILQDGNFYRDNLRTALQEQTYIADGTETTVRPHFTFFGFRYVKLEGFANPAVSDFEGCVVHSDIPLTSTFESGNEKLNRFAQNVVWGQRGNFLDVPTDCPQRDERLGWTGDAQVFSGTACFQMDSAAFLTKYLYDMRQEQKALDGAVPHVVPMVIDGYGSCAWADAAAIIPWNLYLFYGDKALLRSQYPLMRDWVEWVYRVDEESGGTRLWQTGFHFADWLALDTKNGRSMGGTDPYFIASAYYFYSTSLTLKAARVLGYVEDVQRYERLQSEIFEAFQREYFTPSGRLAQTTQTGYICALFMELATPAQRKVLTRLLAKEFEQSEGALRTGFVGTAYLCRVLSDVGLHALAYSLLLREEYPSWLYEVNMGATTVWERWNSVLPDGRISDTGMNSLNHYAYGAVMEWVFRTVAGINPLPEVPGFRRVLLRPIPDARLGSAAVTYESPMGQYASAWTLKDGVFSWDFEIPFGACAKAVFPGIEAKALAAKYPTMDILSDEAGAFAELPAGKYSVRYAFEDA